MQALINFLSRFLNATKDAFNVQLSGSLIEDVQAVPTTQAQKDIRAKAIDNILDVIGYENVKMFLPLTEGVGSTVAYDLLRKDLTFDVSGLVTFGTTGLFGDCATFGGGYLRRTPATYNTTGAAYADLKAATQKAATMMSAISVQPGIVTLKLKRTGTLAAATVRVLVIADNSGTPGTTALTSTTLECSKIDTTAKDYGFAFTVDLPIKGNKRYWIALEYADATGVDDSNYVSWAYETGVNTYGEQRSSYDGTSWTATNGENHVFSLWNDDLEFGDDFSIITCVNNTSANAGSRYVFGIGDYAGNSGVLLSSTSGKILSVSANDGTLRTASIPKWTINRNQVVGITFNKDLATAKLNVYKDGMLAASADGSATTAINSLAYPFTIGCTSSNGNVTSAWTGTIGPVIITKNTLTAAQMADVSHNLMALRKYGVGV